jgi:hypothetical protein
LIAPVFFFENPQIIIKLMGHMGRLSGAKGYFNSMTIFEAWQTSWAD